ncbi:MAG: prenyltransferase [Kiritimatiellia bacterium]
MKKSFLFNFHSIGLCCALLFTPVGRVAHGQLISPVLASRADEVEQALERGFGFLIVNQKEDGSYSGEFGGSAGVVALAGMSFLAAGHTPGSDIYGSAINRCVDYVLAQQNDKGYILTSGRKDKGMYSHNIATLFLAEVSGMLDPERDRLVRESLGEAVEVILKAQKVKKGDVHRGGWRYGPGANDSDLSVSGWALMALRAARLNGVQIPDEHIQDAVSYILGNQSDRGSFGYQRPGDKHDGRVSLTGMAILSLALSGHHDSEAVLGARNYLEQKYVDLPKEQFRLYGLYYCTQAAFQSGGRTWELIGSWLYDRYLPLQQEDGSWKSDVGGHEAESNTVAYRTSLILLSLAVPYRQLPIYQRDETVDE